MSYQTKSYGNPIFEEIERNFGFEDDLPGRDRAYRPRPFPVCAPATNDYQFHRRRAERELDAALHAVNDEIALHHVSLARMHHRQSRIPQGLADATSGRVFSIDKEA